LFLSHNLEKTKFFIFKFQNSRLYERGESQTNSCGKFLVVFLGDFQEKLYRCLSLPAGSGNEPWYIYFWKSP
jgi:hypothetical protein